MQCPVKGVHCRCRSELGSSLIAILRAEKSMKANKSSNNISRRFSPFLHFTLHRHTIHLPSLNLPTQLHTSMNVAGPRTTRTPSGLNPPSPANGLTGDAASGSGNNNAADVDMYLETPAFELSLDEFEEYALARLKVCRCFVVAAWCL
jgi:hypothetical protein